MFPLLPFVLGALAGAAAVNLARRAVAMANLDKAQARLRQATVCGLTAVERSSAKLRGKLTPTEEAAPAPAGEAPPESTGETNPAPDNDETRSDQEGNPWI